jgi:EAL domain-containing protein (putative c-di-GMP-specific phosphodiesterase class I)
MTVAEGIETALHLEIVRELGIHVGQGFLLGRPLDRPEAAHIDIAAVIAAATEAAANRTAPARATPAESW